MQHIHYKEHLWFIHVLRSILKRTKSIFKRAKASGLQQGQTMDTHLAKIINLIRSFSIKFNTMKEPGSIEYQVKKCIEPVTHNLSISLHMSTHDFNFCLKKLKEKNKISPETFALAERNVYFYNEGKVRLIGCMAGEAESSLLKVTCEPDRHYLVLRYLLPCKLFLGESIEFKAVLKYKLT
jgi:hypothetical protein